MSAWSHLPAHLVPCDPDTVFRQRPVPVLSIGTPPSPEARLVPRPQPPPIVTIRPAGPHASELYVRTGDGQQLVVVPLSWGHLINLAHEVASGLERYKEP